MVRKRPFVNRALSFAAIALAAACGGGGGGGGTGPGTADNVPRTQISGNVAALVSPAAAPLQEHTARTDMLIAPGDPATGFPAVAQEAVYQFDTASLPTERITQVVLSQPRIDQAFFMPVFSGTATYAGDPALAKPSAMQVLIPGGGAFADTSTDPEIDTTLAGVPALEFLYSPAASPVQLIIYGKPFSSAINPQGYVYQTSGVYGVLQPTFSFTEGYFSAGVPTLTALPASGTATYAGSGQSSLVLAPSRDPGDTFSTFSVTVDFAARSLTVSSSNTTSVSNNASGTTTPSANTALNFSGTLTFAAGSNTFSGTVTSPGGMTGNVTGRFYGAGIASATSAKIAGSPPEIGGTFALFAPTVGSMVGAFGAR